jgi:hypothetical protein
MNSKHPTKLTAEKPLLWLPGIAVMTFF